MLTLTVNTKTQLKDGYGSCTKMYAAKRRKFDVCFKLKVVSLANSTNNLTAAKEFGINEKQVRKWKKSEELLKEMPKKKCANRGKSCSWPMLEETMVAWI